MIARIFNVLAFAAIVSSIGIQGEAQIKSPRRDPVVIQMPKEEVWLTQTQAHHILTAVEMLIQQVQELNKQNKAPRPSAPGVCDPSYPGCGLVDLSGIMEALCSLQLQVQCLCERSVSTTDIIVSISDAIGSCNDSSVLLGSQVDKACIDSLCLSVISLLKTILLELRGAFTGPFPCNVTP